MIEHGHKLRMRGQNLLLRGWLSPVFVLAVLALGAPLYAAERPSPELPSDLHAEIERSLDETLTRVQQAPPAEVRYGVQGRLVPGASEAQAPSGLAILETHEVSAALTRFRSGGANRLAQGLARFTLYAPEITMRFREAGVPAELALLGLIESGFDPQATSFKQARGIWQFVPATARRYGLRVGARADDRTDLEKSTRAAAQHLADLYDVFRDWPLALAAYNAGESRVLAAIARSGREDFWSLSRSRLLPAETRSYVPAVLATILYARGERARPFSSIAAPGRDAHRKDSGHIVFTTFTLSDVSVGTR